MIGDDGGGHTGMRKLAGRGGREVPQLRLRTVTEKRPGKNTHVLLGELVRNQTALRAMHNHIIQAEFGRNAHGGENIVCTVGVEMHLDLAAQHRQQRFTLAVILSGSTSGSPSARSTASS